MSEQSLEELAVPETENQEAVDTNEDVLVEGGEVETADEGDSEQTDDESAIADDDSEEVDFDGERYKLPKKLKDALLRQDDYTKKTQEVAEQRRAIEAQQQSFQEQQQFQQAHIAEIVKFKSLETQLSQYQNVDWNAAYDADPVETMKLDRQYNALKEQYSQSKATIQQAEQYMTLNRQQETAKQIEQSRVTLASEIKDWSPETAQEIGAYLKTYERIGVTDQVLKDIDDGKYGAVAIVLAHKAKLYDQLMKKASTKTNSPPPKPVTKVGAKAASAKSPENMSDKEFAAWRKKQIKQRN